MLRGSLIMFNKTQIVGYLPQIVFGMVGALIMQIFFIFLIHPAPSIATVNITGMVDSFVKETAKQTLTPDTMKQKVSQFGEGLNKTLQVLSDKKHLIIVPSEAVIVGATDLTETVQRNIKEGLAS